ncbi:glycoside hydrolase family 10 protein [Euzebyella saccharophila]|uniref:Glycoside hydrolase family 10 protein n=1 Tax=Euzebyella saccharophila TaxID=679664 RepID=A0ABV8K152_9FLAO|nr:family 10 glycosylhydrolase [Euzebyella saccharophila]
MTTRLLTYLFLAGLITSCSAYKKGPQPKREFRGFWVATVVNIDWPKNPNDEIAKKKRDYLDLLDYYEELKFNAAIVQVRTAGDAFYKSDFAPWSRYLTGEEGKAPKDSSEDILTWMVQETHKRGMEFHAWLNPYRATFNLDTLNLAADHDFYQHPNWMIKYGKKYYYNPGLPEVQDHMASIITELVNNYKIDGIHYDDYFYPYTIKDEIFNDSLAYQKYQLPGQNLEDWRRSNMDSLIKKSFEVTKNNKPWVQFGVSPFGVWKNKSTDPRGSDTQAGQTTYENLYADPLLWMEKGWLDYIVPQLYWSMELSVASHKKLVDWWSENSTNTQLYIGNGPYKIENNSDKAWNRKKELPDQILYARKNENVDGNVFFSAKSLKEKKKKHERILKRNFYAQDALTPMTSKETPTNNHPEYISKAYVGNTIRFYFKNLSIAKQWVVYKSEKSQEETLRPKNIIAKPFITNPEYIEILISDLKGRKKISYTFLDKYGKESEPKTLLLN